MIKQISHGKIKKYLGYSIDNQCVDMQKYPKNIPL